MDVSTIYTRRNTSTANDESMKEVMLMSDSGNSAAPERQSAASMSSFMSAQGEATEETQPKELMSDTSEQQAGLLPAGSDIQRLCIFGKTEAIYGIAKLPHESVLNALLTTEKIRSSGCFLALVQNQIQLTLKDEKIQLQTTDVIVNSTKPNLKIEGFGLFDSATVSRAISKAAGSAATSSLRQNYPDGIHVGELAIGGPGHLECQKLFHVAIEKYGEDSRSVAKIETLKRVITTCLETAEQMGYTSITFPAIGTGKRGYPPKVVAEAMLGCFVNYAKTQTNTPVKSITVSTGVGCGGPVHTAFQHEETRRTVSLLKEGHDLLVDPKEWFCQAYLHITAHSQDQINAVVAELSGKL